MTDPALEALRRRAAQAAEDAQRQQEQAAIRRGRLIFGIKLEIKPALERVKDRNYDKGIIIRISHENAPPIEVAAWVVSQTHSVRHGYDDYHRDDMVLCSNGMFARVSRFGDFHTTWPLKALSNEELEWLYAGIQALGK